MNQARSFVFAVPCLVAASVAAMAPSLSFAQDGSNDSSPVVDPLLREVLAIPSPDTESSTEYTLPKGTNQPSKSQEVRQPPDSRVAPKRPSRSGKQTSTKEPPPKEEGNATHQKSAEVSGERPFDGNQSQKRNEIIPSTIPPNGGNAFVKGRIGGWAGYVTGTDIKGGYTGRIELDCPIMDYPFFLSIRGEYLLTDGGDSTKTWKDVYGRYGYSYYSYTDKYTDESNTNYGGIALLLWNPIRTSQASVYGGIGFAYLMTKHDADISRVSEDHHSYGRHYGGSYSHRYYRTSRNTSSFHEQESNNLSAVAFRVGSSFCLLNRDTLGVEVSYMPDLYDDASECELRGNYLWKFADNTSFDFFLEYWTEAKTIVGGIGMSVWY